MHKSTEKKNNKIQKYLENPNRCSLITCNNIIPFRSRCINKFCSKSCSALHNNSIRPARSAESKNNTSVAMKGKPSHRKGHKTYCPVAWCKMCNKYLPNSKRITCSANCLNVSRVKHGQYIASISVRRSKQEIELFNLCNLYFTNVTHNLPIVNGWDADIILNDVKTAILWNGPWHYIQMPLNNHSLLQVQTRDRIKINELTNAGWNVLIFEDRHYTPQTAFNTIKLVVGKRIELLTQAYETDVLPLN